MTFADSIEDEIGQFLDPREAGERIQTGYGEVSDSNLIRAGWRRSLRPPRLLFSALLFFGRSRPEAFCADESILALPRPAHRPRCRPEPSPGSFGSAG